MRVKARGLAAYLKLEGQTAGCVVEDISAGGLFLRTDRVVPVGTAISFDLIDSEQKRSVTVSATVVGIILKEAAARRNAPQGLRLRFDRQPGATQASLQRLLGRLGASLDDAPVFYAVTQQPPKAKVPLVPAGASLPALRRQAPAGERPPPPKLDPSPAFAKGPSDADATPPRGERAPSPVRVDPPRPPAVGDDEVFVAATQAALSPPGRAEAPEEEAPQPTELGLSALGLEALAESRTLPEVKRPAKPTRGAALETPPVREPQVVVPESKRPSAPRSGPAGDGGSRSGAAGMLHDVTAYRAALARQEAGGEPGGTLEERTDTSEVVSLRRRLQQLEEALRARDERISDLEAELLSLRHEVQELRGPPELSEESQASTGEYEPPAEDLTPVPPRRRR